MSQQIEQSNGRGAFPEDIAQIEGRLDLLTHEMIDPSQNLFIQPLLQTFDLFPKLPLELHRKIWQLTFPPPRRIQRSCHITRTNSLETYNRFHRFHAPPLASRITQESRAEVLIYYKTVEQAVLRRLDPTSTEYTLCTKKIFFNVERDWLDMEVGTFIRALVPRPLENTSADAGTSVECRRKFKKIRYNLYSSAQCLQIGGTKFAYRTTIVPSIQQLLDALKDGPLYKFNGLKEIRVCHGISENELMSDREKRVWRRNKNLVEALKLYFLLKKKEDENFVVPNIHLRASFD
ncbi:hypothetical protein B0J14DRAFT_659726 [Halenospora varia]|nr:hypothetical protein B0J14DRAFT_659726 [Halenospora varia]